MKIGFTVGVFDLFHAGHFNLLERCHDYCDYLIVGVMNDYWVRVQKGHERPSESEQTRLLAVRDTLEAATVIIVVAGMEGALPSAVAGLVSRPVIAVPTSIGYGASFGGLAALLGMLNSCGSGVTVVNIDNGFGAAYAAAQILKVGSPS